MYKIIGADRREYGPVSAEEIRNWIAEGRADAKTQIRQEGGTDWKPLGDFPEFTDGLGRSPPLLNAPQDAGQLTQTILSREVDVQIGQCIRRSWRLMMRNFWLVVGSTFLILVCQSVLGMVPFVGGLLSWILEGVLYGGLYWLFLKLIRSEEAGVGEAFAGFTENPVQLILTGVVTGLLKFIAIAIVSVPFLIPFLFAAFNLIGRSSQLDESAMGAAVLGLLKTLGVFGVIGILLGVLVSVFLAVIWMFAIPLVVDKKIGFWEAMELSRKTAMRAWLKFFGLMVLGSLIAIAGFFACCVGVFVTIPVAFGAIAYAYEDLFGRPAASETS